MTASRPGPNLSRIATSLGVSVATVSNALSGKGRVSGQLVERIREHAAELGYVPSQAGRALRTGRSGVLGLVLPDIANPLFPKIAQAIEFAASAAGYGVLIADSAAMSPPRPRRSIGWSSAASTAWSSFPAAPPAFRPPPVRSPSSTLLDARQHRRRRPLAGRSRNRRPSRRPRPSPYPHHRQQSGIQRPE